MKNYQAQATNILNKMAVKFSTSFIGYGLFFDDDKQSRDTFRVTFKRASSRFSIKFGQSINDSTGNGSKAPTQYDVLACIQKYDVGSFEDFCGEFGYDEDSRKALKTYKAVCKEYEKVSKFFTSDEIEILQHIA